MIIKIKTRNTKRSYKQLLEYISDKAKIYLSGKEKQSFVITHNLKGTNINRWVDQFKANENYRKIKRKDSVYLTHEILSWNGEDEKNLTPAKMEAMTREYIKLRNPNGIYVAIPHFDKHHYHVHICASGIEYKTGKSLRLTKANLNNVKKEIEAYQLEKFPELSNSIVKHGQGNKKIITDKEYQIKLRTGRATQKEELIKILTLCQKDANSKDHFFELLNKAGLKVYERGGRISGVWFANKKFRLNTIGFSKEKLEDLDKLMDRMKDLRQTREKQQIQKNIHHGIGR